MGILKSAALVYIGYYLGKKSLPVVVKQAESLIAANQDILQQLADQTSLIAPETLAQAMKPAGMSQASQTLQGMGRLRANYRHWVR